MYKRQPASEPIAAEPIASAVVTEDEEVDLSTIHPEVTASAVTSSSQLPAATQIVPSVRTTDPDAQIITSETAALENAAQTENTQTAHTGIGSWFHQRTNQILAVMIAVICGTPIPATTRVVQIDPGPIPIFTQSAPASISAFAPAPVATLPAIT